MEAVAVYSDADADAHARPAWPTSPSGSGPPPPTESYLRIDAIVEAALATGAEPIHPGYGFLSERAAFARAVEDAGLVFVGPPSAVIEALGDKLHARRDRAVGRGRGRPRDPRAGAGRPSRRGGRRSSPRPSGSASRCWSRRRPAAGDGACGGWRRAADLPAALAAGSAEALSAFGDGSVYLEREIRPARHIEVQLLGDATGPRRRHRRARLLDPAAPPEARRGGAGARPVDRRAAPPPRPRGPGRDRRRAPERGDRRVPPGRRDGAFYFLEVNTRLQVEHGVTELVDRPRHRPGAVPAGGRRAAVGRPPSPPLTGPPSPIGHAIEVRLAAEDPARDFAPGPGPDRPLGHAGRARASGSTPACGRATGSRPTTTTWSPRSWSTPADRAAAIDRLRRALDETEVAGIQTTLPFHRFVARHPGFRAGDLSIDWVAESLGRAGGAGRGHAEAAAEAAARAVAERRIDGAVPDRPASAGGRPDARPRPPGRSPPAPTRSIGGRVTRLRVTDRATGEALGDVDPRLRATATEPRPGDRPIVLPAIAPVRRPAAGRRRGRRRRLAVRARGRGRRPGRPPRAGHDEPRGGVHHGPTEVRAIIPGRVVSVAVDGGGCRRGRPAAPGGGGDEDGERAPGAARRDRRAGRRRPSARRSSSATRWSSSGDPRPTVRPGRARTPPATAGARRSGPRRSRAPRSGATRSRPRRASTIRDLYTPPTRPASTRTATSGAPASTRSPGASSRRCTASRFWTMRQYAGFATAEETNPRFRYLLEQGQTGLSVAFDLPTQMGYDSDATEAEGEVGRVGVPISSLADMAVLLDGLPLGEVSHLDDDQRDGADPAGPLRRGGRGPGRPAGGDRGDDPERHPQGVHRAGHLHLPAAPVDAPRDRRLRVLRRRAAQVEHDLDLGLPHARGRGDRRPGAGVHPGRRHRLRRGGRRPRPRRRRLRRAPVVLLRRLVGAVRGGRQVPGRPADVGDDHEGAVRGEGPAVDGLPVPRPDRRLEPDRPVGRQQRGPDDDPGAGRGPRRRPEPPHELARRGARAARPRRRPGSPCGPSRSSPTRPA